MLLRSSYISNKKDSVIRKFSLFFLSIFHFNQILIKLSMNANIMKVIKGHIIQKERVIDSKKEGYKK